MRNTHPAVDAGLVRLGAGMRRVAAVRLGAGMRHGAAVRLGAGMQNSSSSAVKTPKSANTSAKAPACVADAGRVRLGAGMRRI